MNHYKKITAVTALLILCLTTKIFATGAGVQLSGNPGLFINEESVKLEKLTVEKGLPQSLHSFINEMKQQYTMGEIHNKCHPVFNNLS